MAEALRVVIYINGVRFYPNHVGFSVTQGELYSFSATVPAVPEWEILPKRSHGVVFFSDPVTHAWRMLCEGEYFGYSKGKSGEGQRSRVLHFRSLHGLWDTSTYAGLASLVAEGTSPEALQLALANGNNIQAGADTKLFTINELMDRVLNEKGLGPGAQLSAFLPALLDAMTQQLPVEAFYFQSRKMRSKMYAVPDSEIAQAIDVGRFKDVTTNGFNSLGLRMNTRVSQIIQAYEDIAFYQHLNIPAPPLLKTAEGTVIPEVWFTPHLYHVVPPACNVIFDDQIASLQQNRSFALEPTRVVVHLQSVFNGGLPKYYMSNETLQAFDVTRLVSTQSISPGQAVLRDLFSLEELERGVFPQTIPVTLEKLQVPGQDPEVALRDYAMQVTRHHYEVERGRSQNIMLHCSFLPYLLPGFPCLVEDRNGPFFGIIQNVSHSLPATGRPSTSVSINHIREAYVTPTNRTPAYPIWLNRSFQAGQVAATYANSLGVNDFKFAAMIEDRHIVTEKRTVETGYEVEDVPDLDRMAARLIAVQHYDANFRVLGTQASGIPEAERVRNEGVDLQRYWLRRQYRAAVTLTSYLRFHGLDHRTGASDDAVDDPPVDLAPVATNQGGEPLFGNPFRLQYETEDSTDPNRFGNYRLLRGTGGAFISDARQRASRTIQQAVDRGASRG